MSERELAEEAHTAFLAAHPDRDPDELNNDPEAVVWRNGYITGRRVTAGKD